MDAQQITRRPGVDWTYTQLDALRDLARTLECSSGTVSQLDHDVWHFVAYSDQGDAPACSGVITADGRVRTDVLVAA
jgi:hypothetical protein